MRSGRATVSALDVKVIEHFQITADKKRSMAVWEYLQMIQVKSTFRMVCCTIRLSPFRPKTNLLEFNHHIPHTEQAEQAVSNRRRFGMEWADFSGNQNKIINQEG